MGEVGRKLTWSLADKLIIDQDQRVEVGRVLRHREAVLELAALALRGTNIKEFVSEAVRLAARGSGAPMAKMLQRRPETRDLLVAAGWGLKPGIVGHAVSKDDPSNPPGQCLAEERPIVVPDVRKVGSYHLPPFFDEHGVVSSANVPILSSGGAYGVLEIDTHEPRGFDALDVSFLLMIAGLIAEGLGDLRKKEELRQENEFRAVLLREQQHRIRNNFTTIIALLERNARAAPEVPQKGFRDVQRRVFALATIFDHLLGSELGREVDLCEYMLKLIESIEEFYDLKARGIELSFDGKRGVAVDLRLATALGTITNELVANSIEHAFEARGGSIHVSTKREPDGSAMVRIEDNGRGFAGQVDGGTGLNVVRRLVDEIGGTLNLVATSYGTQWQLVLPPSLMLVSAIEDFGPAES